MDIADFYRVPAGYDLLRTSPERTEFRFDSLSIPAGFFNPNSKPFTSTIRFRGRPLPPAFLGGRRIDHVDTLIYRKRPMTFSGPLREERITIPIEILGLALESIDPIQVEIGRRLEDWDVSVTLSRQHRSEGEMVVTKTSEHGGEFDSELVVVPCFTFTRRCDGKLLRLDLGDFVGLPGVLDALTLRSRSTPWLHSAAGALHIAGLNDNFVAGAPGMFDELSATCIHVAGEAPACTVSIDLTGRSRCLCLGSTTLFTASGSPSGGTYQWTIVAGSSKAAIVSGANSQTVSVTGQAVSGAVDDITLSVNYSVGSLGTCVAQISLTTIRVTFPQDAFRITGNLDTRNGALPPLSRGAMQLGPVSPGHPDGTDGYFNKVEIRAVTEPAGVPLPCNFRFRQERQGRTGLIVGQTFVPLPKDCPFPNWCSDDPTNVQAQDATPSSDGSIFMVDAPGVDLSGVVSCDTANEVVLLCMNFRAWVEVDRRKCSEYFYWFSATRIRCDGSNFVLDSLPGSNDVGQGARTECVMSTLPPVFDFDAAITSQLLASEWPLDRLLAAFFVAQAHESDLMTAEDRSVLIQRLIEIMQSEHPQPIFHSSAEIAINLVGLLRAEEAVEVLVEQLLRPLPQISFSFDDASPSTLAGSSLASIGEASVPALVAQADATDDKWWIAAERALRQVEDQRTVAAAACKVLDTRNDGPATRRLGQYLLTRIRE